MAIYREENPNSTIRNSSQVYTKYEIITVEFTRMFILCQSVSFGAVAFIRATFVNAHLATRSSLTFVDIDADVVDGRVYLITWMAGAFETDFFVYADMLTMRYSESALVNI